MIYSASCRWGDNVYLKWGVLPSAPFMIYPSHRGLRHVPAMSSVERGRRGRQLHATAAVVATLLPDLLRHCLLVAMK